MEKDNLDVRQDTIRERGELTVLDVVEFFARNFVIICVFTIVGVVASLGIRTYVPYKWKADITIQVAKVPVGEKLEYLVSPSQVVEDIKSPSFLSEIIATTYGRDVPVDSPSARLFYHDLKVSLIKGTDLVKIEAFGWTGAEAYKNATAVAERVIAKQRVISEHYLIGTKKLLNQVDAELQRDRSVKASVEAIDQHSPSRTDSNVLLKLALLDAKNSEIQHLQQEHIRLNGLVAWAQLHEIGVSGRSLMPLQPDSPSLGPFVLAGAALGFLLGLIFAFGRIAKRRGLRDLLNGL